MSKKAYIIGSGSISPQNTVDENWFFEKINSVHIDFFSAHEPSYKEHIAPNMLRRMGRAIKMGVTAANMAVVDAKVQNVDAIISGTGLGCFEDSEKFLLAIINNNEQYLTPTSFIQSTHNTVGSQIALIMKCYDYNFTYVHRGFSFENCVMDALMQMEEGKKTILIGGIEEHTPMYVELLRRSKKFSSNNSHQYYEGKTKGIQMGEGSTFFVLSDTKKNAYSYIEGISFSYKPNSTEEILSAINNLLANHQTSLEKMDVVLMGFSGDQKFDKLLLELLPQIKNPATAHFKHLCGEYHTAGAFGTWVANKIIEKQIIPEAVKINKVSKSSINTVLIINGYMGINYSFTLLTKC